MSWLSSAIGTVVLASVTGALGGLGVQWFFRSQRRSDNLRALIGGLHSEMSAHLVTKLGTPEDPRGFGVSLFSRGIFDAYVRDIQDLLPRQLAGKVLDYYSLMTEAKRLQDSWIEQTASSVARVGTGQLTESQAHVAAQLMRLLQADKEGCSRAAEATIPLRHEILRDLKERVSHSSGSNSYMISTWRKLRRYLVDRFFS